MSLSKCDQCDYLYINGIGCHEIGCPNAHKERLLQDALDAQDEFTLEELEDFAESEDVK